MGLGEKVIIISVASVAAAVGAYIFQKKKKDLIPWTWDEVGTLKKVHLYPLKSGHRIELEKAECTELGLRQTRDDEALYQLRDRGLIVYGDKDHEFRTARTYPKMVLIDVHVHDEHHLAIDAPTMRTLYVRIPDPKGDNENTVRLHAGEEMYTIDCGEEAASWFSRYILGQDFGLRLGYHDASRKRDNKNIPKYKSMYSYYTNIQNGTGLYTDLTSIHLLTQQSVDDLNKRIGNGTITIENFRPNIVVDTAENEPYAEDDWDWIKIGDVVLRNVKECTRCILTTVNPENGQRSMDREPLKTLEKYRLSNGPNQKVPVMGIHCEVRRTGVIKLGDRVYVSKSSDK